MGGGEVNKGQAGRVAAAFRGIEFSWDDTRVEEGNIGSPGGAG